jgi:maltose alpha-D-glucosyltransferase/alpha-amylase
MLFNFHVNQRLFYALAKQEAEPIRTAYAQLPPIPEVCQWANFLRNHDELDLGRLSDEERKLTYELFAPQEDMRLYDRGIRRRLAPMLTNDRKRLELAYSLILTLPGTPVLRYGDEIGMGDDLSLEERNSVRTPMQWSDNPNGGFSPAPPDRLIHPVISGGEYGFETVNVESQDRDEHSLLNWTEHVLRVRRGTYEFGWGECEFIETGDPAVVAHRCRRGGESVLVLHNLADKKASIQIERGEFASLHDLLTKDPHPGTPDGHYRIDLDPFGYKWFRELKEQNK